MQSNSRTDTQLTPPQRPTRSCGLALALGFAWLLIPSHLLAEPRPKLKLEPLGVYVHGDAEGAAEIAAYDPQSRRLAVVNGQRRAVDILDISEPSQPRLVHRAEIHAYGHQPTSVAIASGKLAVAVAAHPRHLPGAVVLFDMSGQYLNHVAVGALPDCVVATPDGRRLVVANEGEPSEDYRHDPEGSISVIDLAGDPSALTPEHVRTVSFRHVSRASLDPSIRIFGPRASVAQDLEPEYIAISADSSTAYVTLQENNALAVVDLKSATLLRLVGLGFKDHQQPGAGIDASDKSIHVNIRPWPVKGMYQPDGIAAYTPNGEGYLITANEGDARDYAAYSEEARVKDLRLDPAVFPDAATLQKPENIGRLKTTRATGDLDGDGLHEEIHIYGARSFSIRRTDGELIYDSGEELERRTLALMPEYFNNDRADARGRKSRSDDKGPEPEGIAVGQVDGRWFAFIGLERTSAVLVYDVTDPTRPEFHTCFHRRKPAGRPAAPQQARSSTDPADIAPEGLLFIAQQHSPAGKPLLIVTNEVSGTTRILQIGFTSN